MRSLVFQELRISEQEFALCLRASEAYRNGPPARQQYIDADMPRLWRIFRNMVGSSMTFPGPTLDVASAWGVLFPAIRRFLPGMFPYSIAERQGGELRYDGYTIRIHQFECDKDRFSCDSESVGTVLPELCTAAWT